MRAVSAKEAAAKRDKAKARRTINRIEELSYAAMKRKSDEILSTAFKFNPKHFR